MHYFQELPLALFTLMAQMAIGIVIVGQCILRCGANGPTRQRVRIQSIAGLIFFAVATLISLAHTGSPLHGPFTILHIGSSWLSREIAMVIVTGLALLWLAFLRFRRPFSPLEGAAAMASIVSGVILIYVISRVYNHVEMPGWHNPGVFPLFLSSAFMLGALWHALALSFGKTELLLCAPCAARPVLLWALAGFIIMAASLPLVMPDRSIPVNPATVLMSFRAISWWHAAHAVLSGIGVLLAALAVMRPTDGRGFCPAITLPAFIFLLAGEIVGRLAFYLSYSRLGM